MKEEIVKGKNAKNPTMMMAAVKRATIKLLSFFLSHINEHNTRHSESILSKNAENVAKFMNQVNAAAVYANASTRFTDGFQLGMGAEIGISTQKLHARGPMGIKELTTYKLEVFGKGQVRQ